MNKLFSLSNKRCVITGSAGLIGQQLSRAILEVGGYLIMVDINEEKLSKLEELLKKEFNSTSIESHSIDVTNERDISTFVRDQETKPIDVLVNNAAIDDVFKENTLQESMFEKYSFDLWKKSLDVNLSSVFLMCQIVGSKMKKQGGGSIINISSTYGLVAPDQTLYLDKNGKQLFYKSPSYPVAKAGVIALTKYCASYWGRDNVRVNVICPGGVKDKQDSYFIDQYSKRTLLGRMASPKDYNGAVVFLASNASEYMTGGILVVDGGWTAC